MCRILEDCLRFLLDRAISLLGKYAQDLLLMLRSECFNRNYKFHSRITIDRYKLVVLKLDDVSVFSGNYTCHTLQFTRLMRELYRHCDDPASRDQAMLYNR